MGPDQQTRGRDGEQAQAGRRETGRLARLSDLRGGEPVADVRALRGGGKT
ncbi:hypothetical protein ACWC2M_33230 [Streptomyces sp. NPDC001761]